MCLVSVIIPCYNCETYIVETLDSLNNQICKSIEVLCINDGSSDNTVSVIRDYINSSPLSIRLINQNNSGVSKARNRGIDEAKGDYVLFLDSDDIINKHMIEQLLSSMDDDVDVSYCKMSRNIVKVTSADYDFIPIRKEVNRDEMMDFLLYSMGEVCFTCYLYKKSILDNYNIRFSEQTKYFEDREVNWKYLCHCQKGFFIDAPLYGYRMNDSSVTKSPDLSRITDSLEASFRVKEYVKEYAPNFFERISDYLIPRVTWSILKDYSIFGDFSMIKTFEEKYPVKDSIIKLVKTKDFPVRFSSRCYLIHPYFFFLLIRTFGRLR